MTADPLVAPATKPPAAEAERPSMLQRILDASWLTIILAIAMALIVSSVLIAAADTDVQSAAGYVFTRPPDFFSAAWDAIYGAYSALFRGAIYDYQASGVRQIRPITETLTSSVPLIFALSLIHI